MADEFIHDGTEEGLEEFIPVGGTEYVKGIPPQYCPITGKIVFGGHELTDNDAEPLKPFVDKNIENLDTYLLYWTSEVGLVSYNKQYFEYDDEVLPEQSPSFNLYAELETVESGLSERFEEVSSIIWGYKMYPRGGVEYCEIVVVGKEKSI